MTFTNEMKKIKVINTVELDLYGSQEILIDDLTTIYKSLDIFYPKFYKMNHLCKLGFVGVEDLLSGHEVFINSIPKDRIATIFVNHSSSITSDFPHANSLEKKGAIQSPAEFVYTLPNILNGELAIRHGWSGYNAFYLKSNFDAAFLKEQLQLAALSQPIDACILGYVETNLEENYYSYRLELVSLI